MKLLGQILLLGLLFTARVAWAEEAPPHLFNDLNGNGRIDAEEESAQSSSSASSSGEIEVIRLPDTPYEEGDPIAP